MKLSRRERKRRGITRRSLRPFYLADYIRTQPTWVGRSVIGYVDGNIVAVTRRSVSIQWSGGGIRSAEPLSKLTWVHFSNRKSV
jgi:hypothetical protein